MQLAPLMQSSLAASTWSSHGKAWGEWYSLLVPDHGDKIMTAKDTTLQYLALLRTQDLSLAAAKKRLAFVLKLWGFQDVTKDFQIWLLLRGWDKEQTFRDTRQPVSFSLLQRLCMASTFARLLSRHFCFSVASGVWLTVGSLGGPFCPVQLLRDYMARRPQAPSFLCHIDGSPFTRFQFVSLYKRALASAGVPPSDFGTHSFRIGAATVADAAGLSDADIMSIGRWKSDCFKRYVRPNLLLD
ncbi:hypothetical protein GDO81_028645 [Engystomops pustulosus]|uniref:Tyr recombinase domain-containing protein n=1 Tax=Engystomops pustulosus TaxID=76066 RepID=A0AAV6Z571_ENGPU|nr:hypothetical protein GDO81_028645 [Engystomops pustulosus]